MNKNVGGMDKILRIVVGIALLAFALTGVPATGYNYLGWIGVVPLLTGLFGWCPIYPLLGLNSCPMSKN